MSIEVKWQGELQFQASNGQGHSLSIDADSQSALCPTEVLLSALGSCSATDVLLGLQESGAEVTALSNHISYQLTDDEPRLYRSANLHFDVTGKGIDANKVVTAIENAINQYCHVCLMLQPQIDLTYSFEIN